jgi:hypothetical protein
MCTRCLGPSARLAVVALLAALIGCSKPVVKGTVVDVFKKPLPDAAVAIEGTSFSTTTNSYGKYALQFVPGQFKVVAKRDGYTTSSITFNVSESAEVPAADIMLYPQPTEPGIFFVGKEKLESLTTFRLRRDQVPNPIPWLPGSTRYLLQKESSLVLPEGDAQFIDTLPRAMQLARATSPSGLILDAAHSAAAGMVKTSAEKVGEEQLTVWKVHLKPGVYGWIELRRNILGDTVPSESYYGFQVGTVPRDSDAPLETASTTSLEFPGECPGEGGCQFGLWTAKSDLKVYQERSIESPVVARLSKGDTIKGVSSVLVVMRLGECTTKLEADGMRVQDNRLEDLKIPAKVALPMASYGGEGNIMVQYKGEFISACCLDHHIECTKAPSTELWLQVRSGSGRLGWTNQREKLSGTSQYD